MKVFNKYKQPKYTEFSRKDLVVDIKNGHLYFKSNLGVHKVGSYLDTDIFGLEPTDIVPTSEFEWISVSDWALIANINVYGTGSFQGANNYFGGDWLGNADGTTYWVPNCSDKIYFGGQITASCDITSSGHLHIKTGDSSNTDFKTLVIDPLSGKIYRTGSYGGGGGAGGSGDITGVNITAGAGLTGNQNTPSGQHTQTINIGAAAGSGIDVAAHSISVDVSDFMANGADNFVLTATGTDTFTAEAGLMYDGTFLTLTGGLSASGAITASGGISSSGLLYSSASQGFDNIATYNSSSGQYHYTSSQGLSEQLDTFKVTGQRKGDSSITGSLKISGSGTTLLDVEGIVKVLQPAPTIILQDSTDDDDHKILFRDNNGVDDYVIRTQNDIFTLGSLTSSPVEIITNNTVALSIDINNNITASSDISASGLLYASASEGLQSIATYNTQSGLFSYTSSAGISDQLDTFKTTGQRNGDSAITGSLHISSHITASGNISASGTIYANNFQSTGGDVNGIIFNDHLLITGSITSSGDISSSGTITANEANIIGNITASGNISGSGELYFSSSLNNNSSFKTLVYDTTTGKTYHTGSYGAGGGGIGFPYSGSDSLTNNPSQAVITGSLFLSGSGHITSSGTISASGGFIGDLIGTSSVAVTSSYAITASYVESASYAITSSYAITASYVESASYALSSSYSITASYVESSSYATTASYVESSSYAVTAS